MQRRTILLNAMAGLAANFSPRSVWALDRAGSGIAETDELLDRLQAARRRAGLQSLRLSPRLTEVALEQAKWMRDSGEVSHFSGDGANPAARGRDAGYPNRILGEALAETDLGVAEIYRSWIEHEPTRAVLLEPAARDVGLGGAGSTSSKNWWSVVIGG